MRSLERSQFHTSKIIIYITVHVEVSFPLRYCLVDSDCCEVTIIQGINELQETMENLKERKITLRDIFFLLFSVCSNVKVLWCLDVMLLVEVIVVSNTDQPFNALLGQRISIALSLKVCFDI